MDYVLRYDRNGRNHMRAAVLALLLAGLVAGNAQAQAGGDLQQIDVKTLVILGATSVGQFLVGLAIKHWPALESFSNRLIPYTIVILAAVGFTVFMGVPLKEALLMAGASGMGAVLLAEGPAKALTKAGGGS